MRRSLSLLILAGVIPIIALGGTFGAVTLRNQREAISERGRAEANLAAALVAVTVKSNVDAVRMLAQSPALDSVVPDIGRFETVVQRILTDQGDWHAVALADSDGRLLFSTDPGDHWQPAEFGIDAAALRTARASGAPQVGHILDSGDGMKTVPVIVAIRKGDRLRYLISVLIPAARLKPLLSVDPLPPEWTAAILTPSGPLVAIGADGNPPPAPEPKAVAMSAPVEGTRWTINITAPAKTFLAPVRRAALLLIAAAVICLLLLVLLARVLAAELRQARTRETIELQRQRMEALGRLTGGVAHDFNNLLTPIMISLDLIAKRNADPASARHLDAAMAGAERARMLVSRLLSFARQQQLTPEPVDVQAMLDGLMDLIDKSLTAAIDVDVTVDPDLPPVKSDRSQLELAILNLVINARDAMPGGGRLTIAARPASTQHSRTLEGSAHVEIIVSDTGTGMDAATIANATDPFFTTKPLGKGTGLGLSMVQGFAVQSGGAFLLESEVGKGASAIIVLPSCGARPRAAVPEQAVDHAEPSNILIVDDDERVRRATAEVLAEAGHAVAHVADVDQAIAVLRNGNGIDLVITDFVMPGRSGTDLVETLRAEWPGVAVLMVTGHADDRRLPGDIAMLLKPYRPAGLLDAVNTVMRKREAVRV
ncbi:hybrid sensor histidine kinase/response regulator [Nostoc sp. 3335mG]|nr:hybrid sensor histidine kinase/response regulator [Nostoc sp. 3335mG]